jgi:predicted GNAT superfamily acetyltransferase
MARDHFDISNFIWLCGHKERLMYVQGDSMITGKRLDDQGGGILSFAYHQDWPRCKASGA